MFFKRNYKDQIVKCEDVKFSYRIPLYNKEKVNLLLQLVTSSYKNRK